jgi:hypothetical protein
LKSEEQESRRRVEGEEAKENEMEKRQGGKASEVGTWHFFFELSVGWL